METVTDFLSLDSQITADGDCSHEIKRGLLLCDKPRQCIKKQRHHHMTKVHMVKAMFFSVVKSGRESWLIEEAKKSRFF